MAILAILAFMAIMIIHNRNKTESRNLFRKQKYPINTTYNKFAGCSIPYFNLFLYFIVDGLALALNSLGLFTYIGHKIYIMAIFYLVFSN